MENATIIGTPLEETKLELSTEEIDVKRQKWYLSIVGSLMWVSLYCSQSDYSVDLVITHRKTTYRVANKAAKSTKKDQHLTPGLSQLDSDPPLR
jgi:hypothetical protein